MKFASEELSPRARRWIRTALAAWGIFALALCIKVLVEGFNHSVYGAFVSGPRDWWADKAMYLDHGYYYSPTFSVLFTPFTLLPDWLGQMSWGLTSVALLLWSLRTFYREVLPQHWPREAEAAFLLLALAGSMRGLWSLQSNAVLMACILLAAAAMVRYRWWRAAWLLALPVYIKVWPAVAGGLLSVHWPKKLIARITLACVALGLVPFATKAPAVAADYYKAWMQCLADREETAQRFTGYRDAWTIWEQIHSPVDKRAYFALQATAGLAVLAWSLWLRRRQISRRYAPPQAQGLQPLGLATQREHSATDFRQLITCTLAAWTCWQLLLGPGSERLTFLIIAPFAAWAIITSYLERRHFWLAAAAFFTTFVLGAGGIERILIRWFPAAITLQPIGVILFAIWLVRHAACGNMWQQSPAICPHVSAPPATTPTLRKVAA
jgi:hypothetical protein